MLNEMLIDLKFSRTKGKWWDFECVLARIEKKIGGLIGGPFWFTRINKRLRGGRWRGGLLGTKGKGDEWRNRGGRCPGTDGVARSVSRHRCEDEWNDQIEFQPDTRRATLLLSRFQRFTCSRSRERDPYVRIRVCVCVHTIVSQLARVSLLNRVSIRSSKFSHDLYILIEIIHRTAATLKKIRDKSHRLGLETRASVVGFKIP